MPKATQERGPVMLLAAHQPSVRAATVSFQPASLNRSSYVPFHHVHSHPHCFSAWHPAATHFANRAGCTVPFANHFSSLGSITLLRRYFISAGFSPPATFFYFARRPPHLGCVHLAAAIAHSSLILQSIAKVHLHSSAPSVPCGQYTPGASYVAGIAFVPHALLPAPLWGLAVRLHSVVPPSLRRP